MKATLALQFFIQICQRFLKLLRLSQARPFIVSQQLSRGVQCVQWHWRSNTHQQHQRRQVGPEGDSRFLTPSLAQIIQARLVAVPSQRRCWLGMGLPQLPVSTTACHLLVPWLASCHHCALGARSVPVTYSCKQQQYMHSPQTQWPTSLFSVILASTSASLRPIK